MNIIMSCLFTLAIGFFLTLVTEPFILKFALERGLLDYTCKRKIHTTKACRLGGIVILPCLLISIVANHIFSDYDTGSMLCLEKEKQYHILAERKHVVYFVLSVNYAIFALLKFKLNDLGLHAARENHLR